MSKAKILKGTLKMGPIKPDKIKMKPVDRPVAPKATNTVGGYVKKHKVITGVSAASGAVTYGQGRGAGSSRTRSATGAAVDAGGTLASFHSMGHRKSFGGAAATGVIGSSAAGAAGRKIGGANNINNRRSMHQGRTKGNPYR